MLRLFCLLQSKHYKKSPALSRFISERRKREALLGNAEAIAFIQGVEDDIAIERAKL
jgi:hypothetical protein